MLNSTWYYNIYKEMLSHEDCDNIIEEAYESSEAQEFVQGTEGANYNYKHLTDNDLYSTIDKIVARANNECLWRFNYEFIEPLKFVEYATGHCHDWHIDSHNNLTGIGEQRKHTIIVQLSDENEKTGGHINILGGLPRNENEWNSEIFLSKGDVLIFPAFIPYKVNVIEGGLQRMLTGHTAGPAWC